MIQYHYSVEMFDPITNEWRTDKRIYNIHKQITDDDLIDVKGKRMNAKYLGSNIISQSNRLFNEAYIKYIEQFKI